jgi:multidrug efflux pump subunit AcrA (membrane-fusion protein)
MTTMRTELLDLADCTEFRQALEGRPPPNVHAAALLLIGLLGAALAWSAVTKGDLVVRVPGRVRPVDTPNRVFAALSAKVDGRVVEVNFTEGDRVARGDVLLRLNTEQLDNEIARLRRTIQAAEEELSKLDEVQGLLRRQYADYVQHVVGVDHENHAVCFDDNWNVCESGLDATFIIIGA